ncbi:MAG: DUF1573 domain-containing protein [Bacteroidota bacterium]|jgi:hypothetical protein
MKSIKPILLTALVTTLVWSCDSPKDSKQEAISPEVVNNNASADPTATPTSGLPVFEFETDNHEFGIITEGEKVSYTFKFKNTGNAPLVISNASASCGCTVPEYTKTPVAPGEEGEVNVTFDSSGKSGMTTKSVTLIANTEPNTKVLKVSADIQSKKQ